MEKVVDHSDLFLGIYKNKRVLVTGHTGFKGSWLSLWLLKLGARVAGFSKYLPSQPCHFEVTRLRERIAHHEGDIRDMEALRKVFKEFQPQIVFHLAAQPIVRESYDAPKLTFDTNLGGTVNVLECIRETACVEAAVIITSDKCYENLGKDLAYREEDRLGGDDPYSASKACAEIACHAYFKSFFDRKDAPQTATTRAGNVIGGGDWAWDRVIPDCVRAWSQNDTPVIRKPAATRPWQHVLEPVGGYLWLGACLSTKLEGVAGESFNFGPRKEIVKSVQELVDLFLKHWGKGTWRHVPLEGQKKEAVLLKLSCDKALQRLSWRPLLTFEETVELTAQWYKKYYAGGAMHDYTNAQIDWYAQKAVTQGMPWVNGVKV